jgi:hypothetical protein
MAAKNRVVSVEVLSIQWPLAGMGCQCLAAFFREEFLKHHQCLEAQREYFSDIAIRQAEEALNRILSEIDQLSQRDDACALIEQLLRQIDAVTNLSAWTEPQHLH